MRILLTNDDGYQSEGLLKLRDELKNYGEVFVVAPLDVQSAKSCALTIRDPLEVDKFDDHTYIVNGTPADCVIFGISQIKKIDLVVSGCNNLPNLGVDTIYSGTCAACTQALIGGYKAIAFSCCGKEYFSQINKFTKKVMDYILKNQLLSVDYFINVNFPQGKYREDNGILLTKLYYQRVKYSVGSYKNQLFDSSRKMDWKTNDTSFDVGAFNQGYISLTPLATSNFNLSIFNEVERKLK